MLCRSGGCAGAAHDAHDCYEGGFRQQVAGGAATCPGCWQDAGDATGTGVQFRA